MCDASFLHAAAQKTSPRERVVDANAGKDRRPIFRRP
jgi:hypothetical protein